MSLAEGVLRIIEDHARSQSFSRVSAIHLEIGRLSQVDPESLRFCLDAVLRETLAEGARIELEEPPGAGWCLSCSRTVAVNARYDACPACGGYEVQVTGGTEMRVKQLEVQ